MIQGQAVKEWSISAVHVATTRTTWACSAASSAKHCHASGSLSARQNQDVSAGLTDEDAQRRSWMVNVVGELLAAAPSISNPFEKGIIAEHLAVQLAPRLKDGKLRRDPSVPVTRETLRDLRTGQALPQLDTLLKVCSWLALSPLAFLLGTPDGPSIGANVRWSTEQDARASSIRRDAGALEQLRVGLATRLADSTEPPRSLRAIARELGCHSPFLLKRFPEESRAITARFRSYAKTRSAHRQEAFAQEIRAIVGQVHAAGTYPSLSLVSERLAHPGAIQYPHALAAYHQALQDLGLD